MGHKHKSKEFRLTPDLLLRLGLFILIVYSAYTFLTGHTPSDSPVDSTLILGESSITPAADWLYQQLPPQSRQLLDNLDSNPVIIEFQSKISQIQEQLDGFPEKQIKQVQKEIIKNVSDKLIESIDSP